MKILFFLLLGVSFSEQSFIWFLKPTITTNNNNIENLEPTESVISSTNNHRYVVKILKYPIEDGVHGANEFACLGTLILNDYIVAPADCVKLNSPYNIAIQFMIEQDNKNHSLVFKRTEIHIHDHYKSDNNETNNIALVKFFPQGISMDPPIFEDFQPIERSSLPTLDFCSVIGNDVHLSSPSTDRVLINGPGCCGTNQAFCSVFETANHNVCESNHGAPVICNGKFSGFVLQLNKTCMASSGRTLIKYHSVDSFRDWINYYVEDMLTTTPPAPTPASASLIKLSFSLLIFFITLVLLK